MQELVEGQFTHIVFRNEENGYTVGRMRPNDREEEIVLTGIMMGVQVGEELICKGLWKNHPRFGQQFEVQQFEVRMPCTRQGIEQYLAAGQIAGIGPVYAKRIVEQFGTTTFDILDEYPERLMQVDGIGKKTLERIKKSWSNQQKARDIVLFLQQYGVSPAYAQKIFREYGDQSIAKIKENPYRLSAEVVGIGFKKSDEIARQLGIEIEDPLRIDAGIEYSLLLSANKGHSCYPLDFFTEESAHLLQVDSSLIENRIGLLLAQQKVQVLSLKTSEALNESYIWRRSSYRQELQIVQEIKRLALHKENWLQKIDLDQSISKATKAMGIRLAEQQETAVEQSIVQKTLIITGGPGTGKSTITKVVLEILSQETDKILLAAPTGRAAKRMSEITGRKASTIHALLSLDFGSIMKSRLQEPLDADVLIIDEASMIDTALMAVLLSCIPSHCKLILVGDIDQLPSVGPGNVLSDLIDSGSVPVTQLTEIYRQAANSKIVMNAHKINNGLFPDIQIDKKGDFFFIQEKEAEKIAQLIVELNSKRLKKAYSFHLLKDIQVLCPMHKSSIGTIELNKALQKALNNPETKHEKTQRGQTTFSVGDKVMQVKNNYEKSVFNGDIGIIKRIKTIDKQVFVEMDDGREVCYEFAELQELELAYAVTVHKYQGSEAACIILPIHESQYSLLNRNLLYTAVTRAKQLLILVGSKAAINVAVKNDQSNKRYSALAQLFSNEASQALPSIKIAPELGSLAYEEWLKKEFHHEL